MRKLCLCLMFLLCSCGTLAPGRYMIVGFREDPGGIYWQPTAHGLEIIDVAPSYYVNLMVDGKIREIQVSEETYDTLVPGEDLEVPCP